jgi:hypothetical protein
MNDTIETTEAVELISQLETKDLTLAAVLMNTGSTVDHITLQGRTMSQGVWHFRDVPKKIVKQFENGALRVDPQVFHMNIRRLMAMVKDMIDSNKAKNV